MRLVTARSLAMAGMREGGMTALLGASEEVATAVCAEVGAAGGGVVVVANLNGPGQVVLSGERRGRRRAR
jgi:malonyl CoA-acyl carrier protein transacylase